MKRNLFTGFWRFNGIVLLNLLLLFCLSCQKEESQANLSSATDDDITFRDGRLIFKDDITFINHQRWLFENQGNRQLIADKNKSFGLKSMTEYYFEGMKLEETDPLFLTYVDKYPNIFIKVAYDNSTLYMLPHSKLLCYVANKDGIYQVGVKIYRIAGDYIYQLSDGDESKIKTLLLPKDQIFDKDIKIMPSNSDAKGDWAQRTRYFAQNNKYRIVSSLRVKFTDLSNYYEIITNPQKKTLGFWLRAQINTKSANGDGYFEYEDIGIHGTLTPKNDENTGQSELTITELFSPYYIDFDISYVPAYSRGKLNTEYIYVYYPDAYQSSPPFQEPNWIPGVDEPF